MNETPQYKDPSKALEYIRLRMFGGKISYSNVAAVLSQHCDAKVVKSEAWNAEHRMYKCPDHIRTALINMGLLKVRRRWRFFYEVNEEKYREISALLEDEGMTFQQMIEESNLPWV